MKNQYRKEQGKAVEGDVAYCIFTKGRGGHHYGVVIADADTNGRVLIARGTTWRWWEDGFNSRWFSSSVLVDEDELAGTGLHHATRFDLKAVEGFKVGIKDWRLVGHIPNTADFLVRWEAAKLERSRRP